MRAFLAPVLLFCLVACEASGGPGFSAEDAAQSAADARATADAAASIDAQLRGIIPDSISEPYSATDPATAAREAAVAAQAAAQAADAATAAVGSITAVNWIDSPMFKGYDCTLDCSGHEAGYDWAEQHDITDSDDCGGNSQSFIEGCMAYADEQQEAGEGE